MKPIQAPMFATGRTQIFAIEWNGECWQSVFPSPWGEFSQLHTSVIDAAEYIAEIAVTFYEMNTPVPTRPNSRHTRK